MMMTNDDDDERLGNIINKCKRQSRTMEENQKTKKIEEEDNKLGITNKNLKKKI